MFLFVFLLLVSVSYAQRGKLVDPPHRGSMWRHGHKTQENKNDDQLKCGGLALLNNAQGRCGFCGDPANVVREHEFGGKYSSGIISRRYPVDTKSIKTVINMDSKHFGYFEFRLCVQNGSKQSTEACFNKHHLTIKGGSIASDRKRYNTGKQKPREYSLTVNIPPGIICSHCVLQWRYLSLDEYGHDSDGWACYGCGVQRQMRNCADISIGVPEPIHTTTMVPKTGLSGTTLITQTVTTLNPTTEPKPWWISHVRKKRSNENYVLQNSDFVSHTNIDKRT